MKINKQEFVRSGARIVLGAMAVAGVVSTARALPPPPVSPAPVTAYEYDAQDHLTKVVRAKDALNLATVRELDARYRVASLTDPKNSVTLFRYDARDRVTQVYDPRSLLTEYTRNAYGDVTQLSSRDTGISSQTFDEAGNLIERIDSRGVKETYVYDALNRQTSVVYSKSGQTSQTFSWGYDLTGSDYAYGIGRLCRTDHPNGASRIKYDPQGRITESIQAVTAATGANTATVVTTVKYGYTNGDLTSITYPSGRVLTLSYTGGQVSGMSLAKDASSASTPLISQVAWEPFGGVRSWNWSMTGGLVPHERFYDATGRLVRYRVGSVFRDVTYDAANRITAYTHLAAADGTAQTALDQSFGYDASSQLSSITTATSSWAIAYDATGNRTSVSLNGSSSAYTTPSSSNRLASITNPARNLGYDSAGNTTSDSSNYTATYGLSGVLATLTKAGVTATYTYDANKRRIRKVTSAGASSTVIFVYDQQGQLLGEYNQAGVALREYVWLGSIPVAVFTADGSNASNPPWVYYIHADHLDTPRVVIDKNGARRWRWLAEPFGTTAPETNPDGIGAFVLPLRFPGQYADVESGLFYNYFRTYDSSTGRYTQSDPIGLRGGINTYSYSVGNPVSETDPLGLLNPAKLASAGLNAANAGRLYASAALKFGAAIGLTATGVGAPAGAGAAALGLWNLNGAQGAWDRAGKQCKEAINESSDNAAWKNMLGVLPFGTEFDDASEPSMVQFYKEKGLRLLDKPGEVLREFGSLGF